ncbi:MAG: hypothetical protein KAR42_01080 [candidate division Zixibacteria bacterium]|nr:hypothetical protein [candidate division Zixibacteria bacterium]
MKRPLYYSITSFFLIYLLAVSAITISASDSFPEFPGLNDKFSSNTESQIIKSCSIDYNGKVRLNLIEGKIHRRRDLAKHYDYYFEGQAELIILDSLKLDNLWKRKFKEENRRACSSIYICGHNIPQLFELDKNGWTEDKISGRSRHKLQFKLKAPDKYFGLDLAGELQSWSASETFAPPIWIDINLGRDEQLVVYVTPETNEQLNLYVYDGLHATPYLVASFTLNHSLVTQPVSIDSTMVSILLKESGRFEASSKIVFAKGTDVRGLSLLLPHLYKVDSVLDKTGAGLAFVKKHFRNALYIEPREKASDSIDYLTVFYRGKFIKARYQGYDYPANITGWFPHLHHRNLGQFTINYTYYKDLTLKSVGTKIGQSDSAEFRTSTYQSDADISYISFALGKYDVYSDTAAGVPVSFYIENQNNIGLFNRGIPQKILKDLTRSFKTFHDWFGPPIVTELNVVDRMHFAGQSSPGLIHLPTYAIFNSRGQSHLCSHEVAHQWWGHTAVPKTYREMWLSEGLAEYTAFLYLKDVRQDENEWREVADNWRRHVTQVGMIGDLYSRGYRAGPITLGGRLYQSYSPGDYISLVYAKAASMLRMLHFEIDGPVYRTDFFIMMLAEYCRTYHGTGVTSIDFMKIAAKRLGQKRAQQFFQQWLYDWRIPDFECRYEVKRDEKNRPYAEFSITVSEVDSSFSTPFPIEIEFEDGTRDRFRVDNVGQQELFTLGPFPTEIKKIYFDPDNILLYNKKKIIEP